jgi:glutamate formiminotransferase/formiminotetrahydrofolate cyclodeaminase
VIEAIVEPFRNSTGVKLISYFPDPDFNRTVVEVIGRPEPLKEALLKMAGCSYELIDMRKHKGSHPRIGAQDIIPLIPFREISLEEVKELAEEIGEEIFKRYQVPVFFTGENARTPERRNLDYIRKGQFEGLREVAHLPERAPDIGPKALHPTAGATIVWATKSFLVAVNVILGTDDLAMAKSIAKMVRGPSGGFSTIRAIGVLFEERKQVAVSMNMFDTNNTPIHRAFEIIKLEARRRGVPVVGSQVVGTLPQEALVKVAEFYLGLENFSRDQIIESHLLGL